jgi:hypothetical protein
MHALEIYCIEAGIFLAVWIAAWFVFIRPLLAKYSATASLVARLDAAEGSTWIKIKLWFEAKKTLVLAFLTSAFAMGKAATDQVTSVASALTPDALAPLQDKTMWSAFFGDIWTLHIVAALGILTAFLTLKGKVTAAVIVPAPGTTSTPVAAPAQAS